MTEGVRHGQTFQPVAPSEGLVPERVGSELGERDRGEEELSKGNERDKMKKSKAKVHGKGLTEGDDGGFCRCASIE
jgi:hypothetical protein